MSKPAARHHAPVPIRLSHRHRKWVYAAILLLWLSGALWLVFHYFLRTDGVFGPAAHPLETWWLRLHGLAVFSGLTAIGSIAVHHAGRAWQLRRNRLMGAMLMGIFVWLSATGYALYYFSSDSNQTWLPLLHWVPGLSLPAILVLHVGRGRARVASRNTGSAPGRRTDSKAQGWLRRSGRRAAGALSPPSARAETARLAEGTTGVHATGCESSESDRHPATV